MPLDVATAVNIAQLVVLALGGSLALYSYLTSGFTRDLWRAVKEFPELSNDITEMKEKSEEREDILIAVGASCENVAEAVREMDGQDPDVVEAEDVREHLDREDTVDDLVTGD